MSSVGELGKLAISAGPVALLGGRLSIRIPAAALVRPRSHDIMAAPAPDEEESRVVVDAGKERLVLMAYELEALSSGNLQAEARAAVASTWGEEAEGVKLEKLALAPPLTAVAVIPPHQESRHEANLVLGLFIRSEDRTVQYLAFYVNPAGAADTAGVQALCRRIAATMRAGHRRLSTKAGSRSFPGVGKDRLVLTVPEGFVASIQRGPDFFVYRLRKLAPLGQPVSSCGIYLGSHPGYFYRQTDAPPDQVTPLRGMLFGKEVEWKNWSSADEITSEVVVPYPKSPGMVVHVFCTASSSEEVNALRTMAETLQVEGPRGSAGFP